LFPRSSVSSTGASSHILISFVASAAASIAAGWSEPVPGRELHPLESSAFHGALFRQLRISGFRFANQPLATSQKLVS
jgi:hypothetical protein